MAMESLVGSVLCLSVYNHPWSVREEYPETASFAISEYLDSGGIYKSRASFILADDIILNYLHPVIRFSFELEQQLVLLI